MLFEQHLHNELSSINGLKVFPNYAYEDESPPFCIYRKVNSNYLKTLDLPQVKYCNGEYEFIVSGSSYSSLQNFLFEIKNKLINFAGNVIGGASGTLVQDVSIVAISESYDGDTKCHFAEMEVKIFFKE